MSEVDHKTIAEAMAAAFSEMPTVAFDAANPHFGSRFASLTGIMGAVRPVLAKHGLWLSQQPEPTTDPKTIAVKTVVGHKGGEVLDLGTVCLPLSKADPQGAGSGITYARRYGLSAALGIVTDADDDGNEASKKQDSGSGQRAVKPKASQASAKDAMVSAFKTWTGLSDPADLKGGLYELKEALGFGERANDEPEVIEGMAAFIDANRKKDHAAAIRAAKEKINA